MAESPSLASEQDTANATLNQLNPFSFTDWNVSDWLEGNAELTKLAVAILTVVNLLHLDNTITWNYIVLGLWLAKHLIDIGHYYVQK